MRRSVILQLVRDSIHEVLQARTLIDKNALLEKHPLLSQPCNLCVTLFHGEKLFSSYTTRNEASLFDNIIIGAKKAAFCEEKPLLLSEYIEMSIEVQLFSQEGILKEKDTPLVETMTNH